MKLCTDLVSTNVFPMRILSPHNEKSSGYKNYEYVLLKFKNLLLTPQVTIALAMICTTLYHLMIVLNSYGLRCFMNLGRMTLIRIR